MNCRRYVTLKIFINSTSLGQQLDDELKMYQRIEGASKVHPGRNARLFLALDYLHTECKIIHADIKADNIMFGIADDSVFSDFEQGELETPSPRKELDGRIIYVSRELGMPRKWGAPVLCDFGSAMPGDMEHFEDVQPDIYRAPEIWDLFESESLFTGYDAEFKTYRSRAHLGEMISLLGPPPLSLLAQGKSSHKFFSSKGRKIAYVSPVISETRSLYLVF
ncbi:hypothetical protein C2857_007503 [Epichloe festucae Fl1]|uniref:Protein kinase domain-containing protein n=1 Tax=Epichloe festucae (strain Fl1) TaxID=877507 RepID=A0A7S9PTE2_EPIFF|nr:hypothetical protein C2857_007503 [Epichloe festucae Fl1]